MTGAVNCGNNMQLKGQWSLLWSGVDLMKALDWAERLVIMWHSTSVVNFFWLVKFSIAKHAYTHPHRDFQSVSCAILNYAWQHWLSLFPDDGSCMLLTCWNDISQLASVCKMFDMSERYLATLVLSRLSCTDMMFSLWLRVNSGC